jgi:hypothetical protein
MDRKLSITRRKRRRAMKRTGMLILAIVLMFGWNKTALAEEECSEGNFAVVELPKSIESYPEPCSKIIAPANSVIAIEIKRQPLVVKFGENKMVIKKMKFRVGGSHSEYILRPTITEYKAWERPTYAMTIVDVPKHLKGGENALWYEIGEGNQTGEPVLFIAGYATQVLVPRGYNVKIMSDAKIIVKYNGEEKEYQPEEIVVLEGKPGVDLVEIHGLDRDGSAVIGVSPRKTPVAEPKTAPAKKKRIAKK